MAFSNSLPNRLLKGGVILAFLLFAPGCSSTIRIPGSDRTPDTGTQPNYDPTGSFDLKVVSSFDGKATYYADTFQNRQTASGEIYKKSKYTAAHKDLPFNTLVRVTNLKNGRSVVVKINDRGPFGRDREIDLSYIAAKSIDMINDGVIDVRIEVLASN